MECCAPTAARLIHASIVNGAVMFKLALDGTDTNWLVPLNWSAKFGAALVFEMNTVALGEAPRTKPGCAVNDRMTVKIGLTSASGMGVTIMLAEAMPTSRNTL